ncbi:MAG: hypothetical protein ACK47B_24225 [Armatimonadota bacterium]
MIVSQDFREFLQLLNENQVRYLVVGGYAVAYHGNPRFTKDIDLWIDRTRPNAERLLSVLREFGFGDLGATIEDFLQDDQIVQLGRPPNRIDLLTSVPWVEFDACYQAKVLADDQGLTVPLIDLRSLIRAKEASGRLQDLADVEKLEEAAGP